MATGGIFLLADRRVTSLILNRVCYTYCGPDQDSRLTSLRVARSPLQFVGAGWLTRIEARVDYRQSPGPHPSGNYSCELLTPQPPAATPRSILRATFVACIHLLIRSDLLHLPGSTGLSAAHTSSGECLCLRCVFCCSKGDATQFIEPAHFLNARRSRTCVGTIDSGASA